MLERYGVATTAIILTLLTVASAQQPSSTPRDRSRGTFPRAPNPATYGLPDIDGAADYGLGPEQAIAGIEVKLTAKRDRKTGDPKGFLSNVGHAIATARTGPGGGVTFLNVSPGSYVAVFRFVEWAAPKTSPNFRPVVKYASGYEWRVFPDIGYQYAVRAPNLVFKADERGRSRDSMANLVITIAQEFEITGSAPVAVRTAIGYATSAK
jgi:hypothetical protein